MKKGLTELVFIIDRSGSMSGLEDDTIGGFNSMLRHQKTIDGRAAVTTALFDDQYELLHDRVDIQKVPPMPRETYTPRGATALLDAIAGAAKIGIAADRAQNYCANPAGTALIYGSMSAILTAFRTGRPAQPAELTNETQEETEPQSLRGAFRHFREVVRAMKEAADENADDLAGLVNMAKANGGKIPDVNEILREVLSEKNERGNGQ